MKAVSGAIETDIGWDRMIEPLARQERQYRWPDEYSHAR